MTPKRGRAPWRSAATRPGSAHRPTARGVPLHPAQLPANSVGHLVAANQSRSDFDCLASPAVFLTLLRASADGHYSHYTPPDAASELTQTSLFAAALTGLTRVRRFQQDDAHIFCRESQVAAEVSSCLRMMGEVRTGCNSLKSDCRKPSSPSYCP